MPNEENEKLIEEIKRIIEKGKQQMLSEDEVKQANEKVLALSGGEVRGGIAKESDSLAQVRRILEQTDLAGLDTKLLAGAEDRIKVFAQKARRAAS